MIDNINIEMKDFSCVLPGIINKLEFLSLALVPKTLHGDNEYCKDDLTGVGLILGEVADELTIINSALYNSGGSDREGGE